MARMAGRVEERREEAREAAEDGRCFMKKLSKAVIRAGSTRGSRGNRCDARRETSVVVSTVAAAATSRSPGGEWGEG